MKPLQPVDTKRNLFTLFCIVLLDMLGVGIVIPILAPLIIDPTSIVIPAAWTASTRNIIFGFLIAVYPLAQFFGAPILGTLSDRYGRKKVLLNSLFATLTGYILFAVGIITHQLWLLFISRAIDGFNGGSIGVANSSIADMSDHDAKAKNFGLIGVAFGVGFVVGPFLGGKLADPELVSWFNHATPFFFTAILSAINILLVIFAFKETIKRHSFREIHFFVGFENLLKAWKMDRMRVIFAVAFLHMFGFSFFTQFFSVFLVQKFHYTPASIGTFFGYIGLWIIFTQGVLTPIVSRYMKSARVLSFSLLGLSLALGSLIFAKTPLFLYFTQPFVALFEGLTMPNTTAIVSQQTSDDAQGQIMGITQSITAAAQAIPPILAGFIISMGEHTPTLVSAGVILLAWLVFVLFFNFKKTPAERQ